jgi:hypothetical protein
MVHGLSNEVLKAGVKGNPQPRATAGSLQVRFGRFDEIWPLPCRRTEKGAYAIENFELRTNPRMATGLWGSAAYHVGQYLLMSWQSCQIQNAGM